MSKKGLLISLAVALCVTVAVIVTGLLYPSAKKIWYEGASGYQQAKEISLTQQLPILIYFRKKICFQCDRFEEEFLFDPLAEVRLSPYLKVKIEVDNEDAEIKELLSQFDLKKKPALFIQATPIYHPVSTHLIMATEQIWVAKPTYLRGNFMPLSSTTLPIAVNAALVESHNRPYQLPEQTDNKE